MIERLKHRALATRHWRRFARLGIPQPLDHRVCIFGIGNLLCRQGLVDKDLQGLLDVLEIDQSTVL
jgi:hypothetical protein